ncbi:FGGY-family pentulose kinase [Spinellus fusiger]|nr:FGGY-family pentulose kinase [Spinellus fusiger]
MTNAYYLGIDVGTGSARAAIIDAQGTLVSLCVEPISTWNPKYGIYEQSTTNIWESVLKVVRATLLQSKLEKESIKGIGFDATCSLVVLNKDGTPQSVNSHSGYEDHNKNVILWCDHRAIEQAKRINATRHEILRYVGSSISPEMEIPKILWLKENMPDDKWSSIGHMMDLPDFLAFKSTGSLSRSVCSLTCKCSYLSHKDGQGWDMSYFKAIGLECLAEENWRKIGVSDNVLHAGDRLGHGLTEEAANELGLVAGTPVGSAIIDAYAGAISTLGAAIDYKPSAVSDLKSDTVYQGSHHLAIICGTSSCHIAMSSNPIFVPGIWGPYYSVMVPGMWCAEGGQSSTGQLIDYTLSAHSAIEEARKSADKSDISIYTFLHNHLIKLQHEKQLDRLEDLTHHMHIYPDFHGNRSPLADPSLRGTLVGVSLDQSIDDLSIRYLATLQAIACQTRHIIECLNKGGHTIDTLCLSGGLCKNQLFVQLHSNITQCRVILPESIEGAVVIGAAFLGAKAASNQSLWDVMVTMSKAGVIIEPERNPKWVEQDERRYRVFHEMLNDQRKYSRIMEGTHEDIISL